MPVGPVTERSLWVGVDIGKVKDPAALVVLQRRVTFTPGPFAPGSNSSGSSLVAYSIRYLQRLPVGTRYPAVVDRVAEIVDGLLHGAGAREDLREIVIDCTGVGRPVLDYIRERGLRVPVTGVNYTSGRVPSVAADGVINVPKRDLIASLLLLFQRGNLAIAEKLPDAAALVSELVNFTETLSSAGRSSFGNSGEAEHDDYVNAAALAAWRAVSRRPVELGRGGRLPCC